MRWVTDALVNSVPHASSILIVAWGFASCRLHGCVLNLCSGKEAPLFHALRLHLHLLLYGAMVMLMHWALCEIA